VSLAFVKNNQNLTIQRKPAFSARFKIPGVGRGVGVRFARLRDILRRQLPDAIACMDRRPLMGIFLGAFLVVDAAIILSASYSHVLGAAQTCSAVAPLCMYPVPMFILGIIAAGLLLVQKQ
jgi:hypothetical protein